MWKLLKPELLYQKHTLAAFTAFAAAIVFWADEAGILALIIPFLMVNAIIPIRGSEKRDRLHAMLAISAHRVAAARILLVAVPCLGWYSAYLLLSGLFTELDLSALRTAVICFSIILSGYSIAFALNDAFLFTTAATKSILVGFVALGTLFSIFGLWAFRLFSKGPNASPIDLRAIIETIEAHNPFAGPFGNLLLLALSLALAALSVATYVRRRSYLCTE